MRLWQNAISLLVILFYFFPAHAQEPVTVSIDSSSASYEVLAALGLPDGKSVFLTRNENSQLKATILNDSGKVIRTFDYTNKIDFPNRDAFKTQFDAQATHNGNIFITYHSSDTHDMLTPDIRYLVVNEYGELMKSGTVTTTDSGLIQNRYVKMAQLSDGNTAVAWLQSDNVNYACRMFRSDGTAVTVNEIPMAGPGTVNSLDNSSIYNLNIAASNKGGFFTAFSTSTGHLMGMVFKPAPDSLYASEPPILIDSAVTGTYSNITVTSLSNGNYFLTWQKNGTYECKILDSEGKVVQSKSSLPFQTISAVISTQTKDKAGIIIATESYERPNDYSNPLTDLMVYRFDNTVHLLDSLSVYKGSVEAAPVFFAGKPSGFGVAYGFYKSFSAYPSAKNSYNSYYTLSADQDISAKLYNITSDGSYRTLEVAVWNFKGELQPDGTVDLHWLATDQKPDDFYFIEKSIDARNYTVIGKIPAKGGAGLTVQYLFRDDKPSTGANYYRLKQYPLMGAAKDIGTVFIPIAQKRKTVAVYPNPFTGNSFTIALENPSIVPVIYQLFDISGNKVQEGFMNSPQQLIQIRSQSKGIYLLKIKDMPVIKMEKK